MKVTHYYHYLEEEREAPKDHHAVWKHLPGTNHRIHNADSSFLARHSDERRQGRLWV